MEDGKVPAKESRNWKIEGLKRMITRTENQRLLTKFENGRFRGAKEVVEARQRKCAAG